MPLLHAMVVVTVVVVANKGLDKLIQKSERAESLIDGEPREVVRDGVIDAAFLRHGSASRDELFQRLRESGIENLGEVRRAYIEKDGKLTAFRYSDEVRPGLRIVPPPTIEAPEAVTSEESDEGLVCMRCGNARKGEEQACTNCGHHRWTSVTR